MQQDNQTLIEDYLMNRLTPEQRQNFEKQMATSPELADAVQLQQLTMNLIEVKNDQEIRAKVRRVAEPQTSPGGRRYWPWIVGLILLGLMGWAALHFLQGTTQNTSTPDPEQLFAQYFEAYPISIATREINGGDQALVRANKFYQAAQYAEAIPHFEKSLAGDDKPKVRLALALSQLANGQGDLAIPNFQKIVKSKNVFYLEPAFWYRSLAYLQQGDLKSTRLSLKSVRSSSKFYKQAQALIADLPATE